MVATAASFRFNDFEIFSQRYERGSTLVTSNLPFGEWTEVLGSGRLTGALLDRLTHHVHTLEMNGESYRLAKSKRRRRASSSAADIRPLSSKPPRAAESVAQGSYTLSPSLYQNRLEPSRAY